MTNRAYRLLIVEDNEDDLYLILRALGQNAPPHVATCCRDGVEALRMLNLSEQLPDLVIADMGLPKVDGLELLRDVRKDPRFQGLPVLMLSTSGDPLRTQAAHRLNAVVVSKPVQYEQFLSSVGGQVTAMLEEVTLAR